ncbi:D-2-hydroxyacid dehydrogenase [Paraglaciecola aestuariivivens]
MMKLAILSRDAEQYKLLIEQANLPQLQLSIVNTKVMDSDDYSAVDIIFGDPDLTVQVLDQAEQLIWLQSTWAGNAPLLSHPKTNYQLCGVKGIFASAMQEYVFAYLLHFARNIDGFKQTQKSALWGAPKFTSLAGKTIGIMGVGDIGQGIAKTAKHFSMQTKGYTRTQKNCEFIDTYYAPGQEQDFATGLDYLVCLLPESAATKELIDATFLAYLPNSAVLINAGRGTCIQDSALIQALQQKRLKAAVLDVFTQEPLANTHPYWQLDNLFITHHSAAISLPEQICPLFINNYQGFINGLPLKHVLDFSRGY